MDINGISGGAILIVAILFGLVGYAMGKPKGYPGVGFSSDYCWAALG